MNRWRVGMWYEATAAAGLVHVAATDGYTFFGFNGALRIVRRLATLHADGVRFRDVFSNR